MLRQWESSFHFTGHDHDQQLFTIRDTPTLIVSGTEVKHVKVPQIFA